jgi:GH15 family glucan-1,4-alpha-glucosidase
MTRLEDLGLIGNCQFSALVARSGQVAWCCLPRFDSDPVFASLLDAERGGSFLVGPASGQEGVQRYLPNTNVLETRFTDATGSFRVIDFAPRYVQYERYYRPTMMVRIVEPLEGTPMVKVRCDPRLGWTRQEPPRTHGSNHINFEGYAEQLRVTTDVPISYLCGQPFALTERRHLVLTWGQPVEEPLPALCHRTLDATVRYWHRWVKHCNVPPIYQEEVIRSALALKLHCFEDTGAIVAAMTTSIPESPGSGRTWDYRYCWLRDAYYVLSALRLLGHFEEREKFTQYLLDIAGRTPTYDLQPLYRIDGGSDLEEKILEDWPGFEGGRPVRVGNGAATHQQNDVFGELVLALAPIFLDDRFREERSPHALKLVEGLARKAIEVAGKPDAGIWEYRTEWQPQTFSSLMCWAAADRMATVAERHKPASAVEFRQAASHIREEILARAWNPEKNALVSTYGGQDLDAAMLQAATLRLLPNGEPRLAATVDAIQKSLGKDGWLFRYNNEDGFGRPEVAFVICTFWLVEALAHLGRTAEARALLEQVRAAMSPLGLVAEDFDPVTRRMWGNFPQAYSHVGLIHAAFAAAPRWSEVL